jgi:hypothetical protein
LSLSTLLLDLVIMNTFKLLLEINLKKFTCFPKFFSIFLLLISCGIISFCSTPKKEFPERYLCLKGDCTSGYGIQEFNRGFQKTARYEGNFKNGKYEGEGTYTFENKDKYKGSFMDDKISGKGVYEFYDSGDIYKGEFKEELMDGKGVYITKKGNRYEGNFKRGKLYGEGKLIKKDGEIFTGNFKDDYPLGKAVIKNKSGKVIFDGEFIEK